MMTIEDLDPMERAVVEWQYKAIGDFKKALWEAIARADDKNLAKLWLGFPVEVMGYSKYAREPGWWPAVQAKFEKPKGD